MWPYYEYIIQILVSEIAFSSEHSSVDVSRIDHMSHVAGDSREPFRISSLCAQDADRRTEDGHMNVVMKMWTNLAGSRHAVARYQMRRRFIREPETNEDVLQCKPKRYPRANRRSVQRSASKVMSAVFILHMKFMPRMYAITNESCLCAAKDLLDAVEQN
jgi:hypothetical protein